MQQQSTLIPPQSSPSDSSQPQWEKLASKINGEKPPTSGYTKLLLSQDHLILLMDGDTFVYTFLLKDFYWTKHNINRQSNERMTSNSCIVRSGLIVDLNLDSNWTLELLAFDTGEGNYFCLIP